MSHLVESTRSAEQTRELQQLEQLGEFVGTANFKPLMRAHLLAEAAAHQTPLVYRDAAGHLVEEWVGSGELLAAVQLDSVVRRPAAWSTHASLEMAS
jgi:hypothetical protein